MQPENSSPFTVHRSQLMVCGSGSPPVSQAAQCCPPNRELRTVNGERRTVNREAHSAPEFVVASVKEDSLLMSPAR
jgi:hypothetical protein